MKLIWFFEIRRIQKDFDLNHVPLFKMSRTTAWRMIKKVMANADIKGKQATAKGLKTRFRYSDANR